MGSLVWGSYAGSLSRSMLICLCQFSGDLTLSQEPCPSPMQASMLLERNPSLVPLQNLAKLDEKLAADHCDSLDFGLGF